MPGIAGFCYRNDPTSKSAVTRNLRRMQDLLGHDVSYRREAIHVETMGGNGGIAGTRISTGIVHPVNQPATLGGIRVWMEGEILNRNEFLPMLSRPGSREQCPDQSDAFLIAELLKLDPTWSFLRKINGVFSAVVVDLDLQKVHMLTDRHGLSFLYFSIINDQLAWSSEVKSFLALDHFSRVIDPSSMDQFLRVGHLTDDQTWFRDAKLLPPAMHATWCTKDSGFVQKDTYWSWDEVQPMHPDQDFREQAEESARLFSKAVTRCQQKDRRVGVLLSGGLDSRAILSAMNRETNKHVTTLTFGLPESSDLQIAREVSKRQDADHAFYSIDDENWFKHREEFVWYLDGHLDWQHMNHAVCAPDLRQHFDVNLSGFLGDATIGGSYLSKTDHEESRKIIDRGRRFIACGVQIGRVFTHERLPFFDNEFLTHCMQIPADIRRHSRFYFWMLQHLLPPNLQNIPWQQTGLDIHAAPWKHNVSAFNSRVQRRLRRAIGLGPGHQVFVDHARWLKLANGTRILDSSIFASDSPAAQVVDKSNHANWMRLRDVKRWRPADVDQITRALTLDLFLRRVNRA